MLTGNNNILFAAKRQPNIRNLVSSAQKLCFEADAVGENQKCLAPGCLPCKCIPVDNKVLSMNSYSHKLPMNLNCKSDTIIYANNCKICTW